MTGSVRVRLEAIYRRLLEAYGPQGWWPGESDFETVLGAYLTQNTTWRNAALALANLKARAPLEPGALEAMDPVAFREAIRPAGYYNQKARKIQGFLGHLRTRYGGRLDRLFERPTEALREELLGLWGVGPETADSILCYAAHRPVFVVDKYTIRLFSRHGLCDASSSYEDVQRMVHRFVPRDTSVYNEFHALIVRVCVAHCRVRPQCGGCPLECLLTRSQKARLAIGPVQRGS